MATASYWNYNGTYQSACNHLNTLIPDEGRVTGKGNKHLERLRRAANYYYQLYNNGNFTAGAAKFFKIEGGLYQFKTRKRVVGYGGNVYFHREWTPELYSLVEQQMDIIVRTAAIEQMIPIEVNKK